MQKIRKSLERSLRYLKTDQWRDGPTDGQGQLLRTLSGKPEVQNNNEHLPNHSVKIVVQKGPPTIAAVFHFLVKGHFSPLQLNFLQPLLPINHVALLRNYQTQNCKANRVLNVPFCTAQHTCGTR